MSLSEQVRVTLGPLAPPPVVRINPAGPQSIPPDGLPGVDDPIPRVIHMAWLGPKPLTELNRRCILSWIDLHPDWRVYVWCDEQSQPNLSGLPHARIHEAGLATGGLFRAAPNFGEASDILRYELLREFGGVWTDCDVECLRPIDEVAGAGMFACAGSHPSYPQIENAVMGACPEHPLIESLVRALPLWCAQYPDADTIYRTGPVYLDWWARVWMGRRFEFSEHPVRGNSLTIYPKSYFYQEAGVGTARATGAYGYHHWTGSWYR